MPWLIEHKSGARRFILPLIGFFLLMGNSCISQLAPDDATQISLKITINNPSGLNKKSQETSITRVVVIVSAYNHAIHSLREIGTAELAITDRSAEGTISVPMGEYVTFRVMAYDENEILQYQGMESMEITEKTFTVEIELNPNPPNGLTLRHDTSTGLLTWTRSTDLDFASYRLYRAPSPGVTLSSDLVYTTTAVDSALYDEKDPLQGDHYYRVYAVDTEGLVSEGSNEVRLTFIL